MGTENSVTNLLQQEVSEKQRDICVIRITTSCWHDSRGLYSKKSIKFLKRKSTGYNILTEDCMNIGADEVMSRIINLSDVLDGVYRVDICNVSKDWETGNIEDYDFKLTPE